MQSRNGEHIDSASEEIAIGMGTIGATTKIKPWSPDTPYIHKLRSINQEGVYKGYLNQRKEYALSPAFFFDCGDFFLSNNERQLGLRVLSNLMEMNLEDVGLMRMYAWHLQQAGELHQAIAVFESVLALRDDEPQSHRDLALALSDRWEMTGQKDDILRAMELLYTVALQEWERFPDIEIIALMELNRLINLAKISQIKIPGHFDSRLIKLLDLDIRISMSWDADLTDIDLHVFEPTGEHANFAHRLTEIGGLVSRDFRDGYGPEEYVLRRAVPGVYKIKAHYFGSHQQTLCGPCTVTVNVFTNYGRSVEVKQVLTLRLEESGYDIMVGEVTVQGNPKRSADTDDALSRNANNLQKGMSVDKIFKLLGQPHRVRAENDDKTIVLAYVLPDMTGAEVEIVS